MLASVGFVDTIGDGSSDGVRSLAIDADGNAYLTGQFRYTLDFDPGPGTFNLTSENGFNTYIAKYSPTGSLVWAEQLRALDGVYGNTGTDIAVDQRGDIWITGEISGTTDFDPGPGLQTLPAGQSGYLLRLGSDGAFKWVGGAGGSFSSLAIDGQGNVISTGSFIGTRDFDPGPAVHELSAHGTYDRGDVFILKVDNEGRFLWAQSFGGESNERDGDQAKAIAVDPSGNIYATGIFEESADLDPGPGNVTVTAPVGGQQQIFVVKFSASGEFVWGKGQLGTYGDARDIAVDSRGNVYTVGEFSGTVDLDPGNGVVNLTAAGGQYFTLDGYISKLDTNGTLQWSQRIGNEKYDSIFGICLDGDDAIYTTGRFNGTFDFDPGPSVFNLTATPTNLFPDTDIFVRRLDSQGRFVEAYRFGGSGYYETGIAIAVSPASHDVYFIGAFDDRADFDPGPGTINRTSRGYSDVFLVRLKPDAPVALNEAAVSGTVFDDLDQDGAFEPGAGETPIAGRTVFLDLNHNGRWDATQEPSRVTGANGSYTFDKLAPGHYSVGQLPAIDSQQTFPVQPQPGVKLVNLAAVDLVFDPVGGKIYASTGSEAGALANSIVVIDPTTGTVINSVPLGGGGGKLAISDDGQFLYVAMDGAVQRVDLATLSLGIRFSIAPLQVDDMAVMPGNPHTIAVERRTPGLSPRDAQIAIYDDGVQRPGTAGGGNVIEFGSGGTLYGYINEVSSFEFNRMVVTPTGISGTGQSGDLIYGYGIDIEYDNGLIYTTSGGVVDPAALATAGSYAGGGSVEPVSGRGLTFFLNGNTLRAFDQQTFLPVGSLTIPGVSDTGYGLIHWGTKGLAFRTSANQIGLVEWAPRPATHEIDLAAGQTLASRDFGDHSTVQPGSISGQVFHDVDGDGAQGPGEPPIVGWMVFLDQNGNGQLDASERTAVTDATGNYSFTGLPPGDYEVADLLRPGWQQTSPAQQPGRLRQIDVAANDIVYSPVTGKIYASLGSNVDVVGNSIAVIDPVAGQIVSTVFVGSEPNKLAVSDDGRFLYVALNGASAVRRVDLNTLTAGQQFSINPYRVHDLEVVPGQANSVVVTRFDPRFSPSGAGAAVYDDGVRRPQTSASSSIEFSGSASVLYGIDNEFTAHTFYRMTLQGNGVSATKATDGLMSGDIQFDAGRIYATDGAVVDPETHTVLGTMGNGAAVAPSSARGLTFYIGGSLLSAYDQQTFGQVGTYSLPNITQSSGLIDWGASGLAFRGDAGRIVLVEWDPRSPRTSRTNAVHLTSGQSVTGRDFGNLNTAPVDPPVGNVDSFSTNEDVKLTIAAAGVLANDTDPNDPVITAVLVTGPAHGKVALSLDGGFTYTPNANYNGPDSFTYRANDNQGLSGITTVSLSVAATNDAPSGQNRTITKREDTVHIFAAGDFTFTDPQDTPDNNLLAVRIASLPATGSLTNNGVAVAVGDFIPVTNITGGLFRFTPPADTSGAVAARFTFAIQDDGGTAHGGVDLDSTPNTITFNITSVNDAPSGTDRSISISEDTAYTFKTSDFGFSDSHDSPPHVLAAVRIVDLPATGAVTSGGVVVAMGQVISAADISAGLLRFTPPANASGSPLATLTFQVKDNGGTANSGIDLDPTPNTIAFNLTNANDPPSASNDSYLAAEDFAVTVPAPGILQNDTDTDNGDTRTIVAINGEPLAGQQLWDESAIGDLSSSDPYPVFVLQPGKNTLRGNFGIVGEEEADFDRFVIQVPANSQLVSATFSASRSIGILEGAGFGVYPGTGFPAVLLSGFEAPVPAVDHPVLSEELPLGPGSYFFFHASLTHNTFAVPSLADYSFEFQLAGPGDFNSQHTLASGALLDVQTSGGFAYNPNGKFESLRSGQTATDSFEYTMADGQGAASTATATITISGANDPPRAVNDTGAVAENGVLEEPAAGVLANDTDVDAGDTKLVIRVNGQSTNVGATVTLPSGALVHVQANGSYRYDPNKQFESLQPGQTATDSFSYQMADEAGVTATGTVTITIHGVNDAPQAVNDAYSTMEDVSRTITPSEYLLNDADADSGTLTGMPLGQPGHGSVVLRMDGSFVYTPTKDYHGPDSFTYQISDGLATSNVATISLNVTPVNEAPVVALGGNVAVEEGSVFFAGGSFVDSDSGDSWLGTVDYGDGTGQQPLSLRNDKTFALNHAYADDGNYVVAVSVQDSDNLVGSASIRVVVHNAIPQILSWIGPIAAGRGQILSFIGQFTDPGAADTHTATVDWGDRSGEAVVGGTDADHAVQATHRYATGGIYEVALLVSDDDGGLARRATTVLVAGARLNGSVFEIVGTAQRDKLNLLVTNKTLVLKGTLGGQSINQAFTYSGVQQIVAYLGDGNDSLTVDGKIKAPLLVNAGAGNDTVRAGGGAAVLIGGVGQDALTGGSRSDLLIGGTTVYDNNPTALLAILSEWASNRPLAMRSESLRFARGPFLETGGFFLKSNETVIDDGSVDSLMGSGDLDWFFADLMKDKLKDRARAEAVN